MSFIVRWAVIDVTTPQLPILLRQHEHVEADKNSTGFYLEEAYYEMVTYTIDSCKGCSNGAYAPWGEEGNVVVFDRVVKVSVRYKEDV